MQRETQIHDVQRELTDAELSQVAGGGMMDLVVRGFENVLKECLKVLTREGEVLICPVPK